MSARVFVSNAELYVAGVDRFGCANAYSGEVGEAHSFPSRELAEKCAETERRRFPQETYKVQELTDG